MNAQLRAPLGWDTHEYMKVNTAAPGHTKRRDAELSILSSEQIIERHGKQLHILRFPSVIILYLLTYTHTQLLQPQKLKHGTVWRNGTQVCLLPVPVNTKRIDNNTETDPPVQICHNMKRHMRNNSWGADDLIEKSKRKKNKSLLGFLWDCFVMCW